MSQGHGKFVGKLGPRGPRTDCGDSSKLHGRIRSIRLTSAIDRAWFRRKEDTVCQHLTDGKQNETKSKTAPYPFCDRYCNNVSCKLLDQLCINTSTSSQVFVYTIRQHYLGSFCNLFDRFPRFFISHQLCLECPTCRFFDVTKLREKVVISQYF